MSVLGKIGFESFSGNQWEWLSHLPILFLNQQLILAASDASSYLRVIGTLHSGPHSMAYAHGLFQVAEQARK